MISRILTLAAFAATAAALALLVLYSRRPAARVERFGTVLLVLMRHRAPRIAVLLAWWWAGWHFLAYLGSA